jgi:hypothetical protein
VDAIASVAAASNNLTPRLKKSLNISMAFFSQEKFFP